MAVQIYSFSALLEIDCNTNQANINILKNTFPSTSTPFITADGLRPYITFEGVVVNELDCVFNTGFGLSLVDDSGTGSGYNKFGMVVPRVLTNTTDTIVDFGGYEVRPAGVLEPYPFITYAPYYFNFKQYLNV